MLITALVTTLALQAAPPRTALQGKARPDTIVILDSVVKSENAFFSRWTQEWEASEASRHSLEQYPYLPTSDRVGNVQCLPDLERFFMVSPGPGFGPIIASRVTSFSVCPSWYLGTDGQADGDERTALDAALTPERRPAVTAVRHLLIALLESAVRAMPSNNFLVGQEVRFLVDNNESDRALVVAHECRASRWWCLALQGYALARAGNALGADEAFKAMRTAQSLGERCSWLQVSVLLANAAERRKYDRMSCSQRDSIAARVLWLSDPLFVLPGNERRVEQFVRQVTVILHTALERDERYDWRFQRGSDARAEMIARYGWPSYTFWSGRERDFYQSRGLSLKMHGFSPPNEPYTTYEYTRDREHLLPALSAAIDPFHAAPSDWSVLLLPASETPSREDPKWFPSEHFASPYPVVQLPEGQVALLRRQTAILLATATRIETPQFVRETGAVFPAVDLVTCAEPDGAVLRVAETAGVLGSVVTLHGLIDPRPTMVGVEIPPASGRPAARTRFGVTPPQPLSAMRAGEVAISDPVLLRAPNSGDDLPTDPDSALSQMAGSKRVGGLGRIGVYWETYGFKPSDTVDVSVWIERHTPQGIARNFGVTLRVATDLNTPVSVSWHEPQPEHRVRVIDGPVPVISRSVILDVSKLARGDYWLDIVVGKPGSKPARGRSSFTIQ